MTTFFAVAALLALGGLINVNRQVNQLRRDLRGLDPYGTDEPTE